MLDLLTKLEKSHFLTILEDEYRYIIHILVNFSYLLEYFKHQGVKVDNSIDLQLIYLSKIAEESSKIVELLGIFYYDHINQLILDHQNNLKGQTILIYQSSPAIRSWKCAYTLYGLGYDICLCYSDKFYDYFYERLYTGFISRINQIPVDNYEQFLEIARQCHDVIFTNPADHFAYDSLDLDPIYYIGDIQFLRFLYNKKRFQLAPFCYEIKILLTSKRLVFTNHLMVERIQQSPYRLNVNTYQIVRNSHIRYGDYQPTVRDYRQKDRFRLVFIGSISTTNSYWNMLPLFRKILDNNSNFEIDLYLSKFNIDTIQLIVKDIPRLHLKQSIPQSQITSVLTNYDFGLCIFNLSYKDAPYIEIVEPNKYFDYYYSNLPMIGNNTKSLRQLISDQHLGVCVDHMDEITTNLLQDIFYDQPVNIISYQQELQTSIIANSRGIKVSYRH